MSAPVISEQDMDEFATAYFKAKEKAGGSQTKWAKLHAELYGFLAQIVPYQDPDLERLHLYGRHLLNRLPRRADGGVDIGEVDLSHLRVTKTIDKCNAKFGTEFTEEGVLPAFNATKADPKVRAAAVVNDEDNFGVVFDEAFNGYMMDHVSIIDTIGKRYFGADRGFKSKLETVSTWSPRNHPPQ